MKNFTIKERQEIYEHLLTLDCPDLLAALIVKRANRSYTQKWNSLDKDALYSWTFDVFDWGQTEEGEDFWDVLNTEVYELTSDFESPTEADFADTEITTAHVEINLPPVAYALGDVVQHVGEKLECTGVSTTSGIESPEVYKTSTVEKLEATQAPLSFWTKIKLFFGKWSYKV